MPGQVKRKYISEINSFRKELRTPIYLIAKSLPYHYDCYLVLKFFRKYFPHKWMEIEQRCKLYKEKDDFLSSQGKRRRYRPGSPEYFFFQCPSLKRICSDSYLNSHKDKFSEESMESSLLELEKYSEEKILKHNNKVENSRRLMQEIEPLFIDIFINEYYRREISLNGKIEIVNEMKKFICDKSIRFFHKLNDSERNNQIRMIAFYNLQKIGEHVKLRKKFKGKTKSYMIEREKYIVNPKDLIDKIDSDGIQNKKSYDFFISHSFMDGDLVLQIIKQINAKGYSVYCDWTSDSEFLKRSNAGKFTEAVLQKRISQSRMVLFICTINSTNEQGLAKTKWLDMELSYASSIGKKIYSFNFTDVRSSFSEIRFIFTNMNFILDDSFCSDLGADIQHAPLGSANEIF